MNKELRSSLNELNYDQLNEVKAHVTESLAAQRTANREKRAELKAALAEVTPKRAPRGSKVEEAPKKKKRSKRSE
jgi:antitoxin component of MazEF toxin-antitoxin module